jgi:hypothetical protein
MLRLPDVNLLCSESQLNLSRVRLFVPERYVKSSQDESSPTQTIGFAGGSVMRAVRLMAFVMCLTAAFAVAAEAAPVTLTLQRTDGLYNEDPPGAPLPLGRTQYDAGNVLLNGRKIGEYLCVKDVHAAGLNTAAVTLTIFLPNPGGAPVPITLQGSHDFSSGNGMGSISASSVSGFVGVKYTSSSSPHTVTLLLP